MAQAAAHAGSQSLRRAKHNLVLGALGVVYGDIGTSPLYTVKQCFDAEGAITPENVLGVLSLIAWSLMMVVTVKYVIVIMRADNRGEGGILALTALALRSASRRGRRHRLILMAGLVGAALFYGDGVITPAISVLSAIEGLKVATPFFDPYVIPITVVVLIALFAIQRRGTSLVGGFFGPVMVAWFAVLAVLGAVEIWQQPAILQALNPLWGLRLLASAPLKGFVLMGAVVLAVTGAEALYADMGHFGAHSIRLAWFRLVFPALVVNYFGQGALLLRSPAALENPFYRLVPSWGLYPMVALSAVATVIASQAVISGAFSMTQQAIQLGYLPRMQVRHTSEQERGQIYVPTMNVLLLCAVLALVLGFKSSDNLGTAYGIAVTGTMTLTTVLAFTYMSAVRHWNPLLALGLFGVFLVVDVAFFSANLIKIEEGGWFPLLVATLVYMVMFTWMRGRSLVVAERQRSAMPLDMFLASVGPDRVRAPGTAIFMTGNVEVVPGALLHNLKHNKFLHERVVLMCVHIEDFPRVADDQRFTIRHLEHGFHTVVVHYGFMDEPNIPRAL
ncbi:MAG TPA: KUP/HAK/KT family potassium transporter, partial [Stellaceae bacterium]|nr:KUP/HAK/KT family potassium transporter [Stellaceae bacterium]